MQLCLRLLPVSDPARLYRIGDGDDCCVEGGPQDRWGMFSYPLYERLKAETPESKELAAFQAGGGRMSVRHQGADLAARPLRSEYVTGNYFSTLGVRAFAGRLFTPEDDKPASARRIHNRNWLRFTGRSSNASITCREFKDRAWPCTTRSRTTGVSWFWWRVIYTVAQRTNEIGIRMALGVDRKKVVALVLRGAFQRVLIGLALGLPLAVAAGRLISTQLYGVSFWDPFALTAAAVSLTVCAVVAAFIPANRAASISPINALRNE